MGHIDSDKNVKLGEKFSLFESINASVIKCNECEVGIVAFLEVSVRVSPTLEKCGRRDYQIYLSKQAPPHEVPLISCFVNLVGFFL